jgi:hypothetical protein
MMASVLDQRPNGGQLTVAVVLSEFRYASTANAGVYRGSNVGECAASLEAASADVRYAQKLAPALATGGSNLTATPTVESDSLV